MKVREEGFWVFQEGSGGDGMFHVTHEAAEEAAQQLPSDVAILIVPAVRFTSKAIERQRAQSRSADTTALRERREVEE